jgi:cob(I)alamin adenosyltransferase
LKIYTKKGDTGQTSLFGGTRVAKHHIRIEAYGTVDELNSFIGYLSGQKEVLLYQGILRQVQDRLFTIGSNLAADPSKGNLALPDIRDEDITLLENEMDRMEEDLPELRNFILPGGHPVVGLCHVVRTVCRRAERQVVALAEQEEVPEIIVRYLNRLSDYFFMLARRLAHDLGIGEIAWRPRK